MSYYKIYFLLCCLILNLDLALAAAVPNNNLMYIASYRGLFSAGFRLDIAKIIITQPYVRVKGSDISQIIVSLTTRNFTKVELFFPMRFCYRTKFKTNTLATQQADWISRLSNKATRGRTLYNNPSKKAIFLQVERKLNTRMIADDPRKQKINNLLWASNPDPDVYNVHLVNAKLPIIDRLTMLEWLRRQNLVSGMVFNLPVTDGRKLLGFNIKVVGEEKLKWRNSMVYSWKIRLQSKFSDNSDDRPIWMWLSKDKQRLPLLFSSSHALGSFQVRLVSVTAPAPICIIKEATVLALPKY